MCTDCFLVIFELSNTNNIGDMPGGDHCAVWGCDIDRRYPEKQKILPHVGILRFHSPKSKKDVLSWARATNPDQVEKVQIGRFRSDAQLNMSTVSAQVPVILLFLTCSSTEFEAKRSGSKTFGFFSIKLELSLRISSCFLSLVSSLQRAIAR